MAKYKIEIVRSAEKFLYKLPKNDLGRVIEVIQSLAANPFPHGTRKLSGEQDTYRVRVGNYRVIYEIYHKIVLIKILKIGDRKEVYR